MSEYSGFMLWPIQKHASWANLRCWHQVLQLSTLGTLLSVCYTFFYIYWPFEFHVVLMFITHNFSLDALFLCANNSRVQCSRNDFADGEQEMKVNQALWVSSSDVWDEWTSCSASFLLGLKTAVIISYTHYQFLFPNVGGFQKHWFHQIILKS